MVQKILRTMQDDLKEAQEQKQKGREAEDDLQQNPTAYKKEIEAFITEDEAPISDNLGAFNHSSSYFANTSAGKQQASAKDDKEGRRATEEARKKAPVFTSTPATKETKPDSADSEISDLIAKMEIPLDNHEEKEAQEKKRQEEEKKQQEAKKAEEERIRKVQEAKQLELDRIKKQQEQEEQRQKEEAKRAEEEQRRKEQEAQRLEEERMRKEQEAQRLEEERIQKEQEAQRLEEERMRKEQAAAEQRRKEEEERLRKAQEDKRLEEERIRRELEIAEQERKEAAERMKKEQEARELEEERLRKEQEAEEQKRKEDEKDSEEKRVQRVEEERQRMEELKKRAEELEELKRREEDLEKEEAIAKQLEDERKQIELQEYKRIEELKQKEADMRKAEEAERQKEKEMKLREEEEIRQTEEEAKLLGEKAKQIEEDLRKKEEELKKMEESEKRKIEELKKKEGERIEAEGVLRKKEAELKRREALREERGDMIEAMREEIMEDKPARKAAAVVAPAPAEITPDLPEPEEAPRAEAEAELAAPPIITEAEGYAAANGMAAPVAPVIEDNLKAKPSAKDEELSNLVKRVSGSMSGKVVSDVAPEAPAAPASKPEKDKELKDLISRMSKNLEKEKQILQDKGIATEKEVAPEKNTELKSLATRIANNFHKDKSPEAPIAPPLPTHDAVPDAAPAPTGHAEDKQDSYWTNLRDNLKTEEKVIRLEETPLEGETQAATETKITEFADKRATAANIEEAGLIIPRAKTQAKEKLLVPNKNPSYLNAENRLVGGKQEFYSSLHKRVKPKEKEADLESLKDIVKDEEAHLSDEEEKKMLRRQIVKKYKIKLSAMPWAKIIIFTVLLLGTLGVSLYLVIPKLSSIQPGGKTIELTTGGSIAAIDERVSDSVTVTADKVASLNYFDNELEPWNAYPDQSIVRLNVNYSDHNVLLPRDEALKTVLGESRANNLPADITKLLNPGYNFLVFKNNETLRMGLALQFDGNKSDEMSRAMSQWQEAQTNNSKMYSVMRALFVNSKLDDRQGVLFQDGAYNGVVIHYANLPDTDTSIDYFIKGDLLVITTSKSTSFEMIDLLAQ